MQVQRDVNPDIIIDRLILYFDAKRRALVVGILAVVHCVHEFFASDASVGLIGDE